MDAFPFSADDWNAVTLAGAAMANASLMDDGVLGAARFVDLAELLHQLKVVYGEHPVLIETEADFTTDAREKVSLYEHAKEIALIHGLPTFSIRLSLARVLLEDLELPEKARQELQLSRTELFRNGDEYEHAKWLELMEECDNRKVKL